MKIKAKKEACLRNPRISKAKELIPTQKEEHEAVEKEFGLQCVERITVPFNKFLEQLGRLRMIRLS